ncbi:MAG TPA: hypothetical protein VGK73_04395 [Polyangiaceae bacterium]
MGPDWLYIDENTTALSSVDAVNALTDMSVQGTTSNCPGTYGPRP